MTLIPEQWKEPFPESEIPHVLAGIVRCMAGEMKRDACEGENAISIRLWKRLRRDPLLRKRPIQPDPETWEINENDPDGIIGRLDIRFVYSTLDRHPWPIFAVEAKRLHVEFPSGWKSLVSEYVTADTAKAPEKEQGMMCFVTGRYSNGLRAGVMLGYVFDGDVAGARASIKDAITKHRDKLKVLPDYELRDSAIVSGIAESIHDLVDEIDLNDPQRGLFTIYHILVAV